MIFDCKESNYMINIPNLRNFTKKNLKYIHENYVDL